MDISVLVTEEQLKAGLIEHLRAGRIPENYFYWSPPSAKAWLDLRGSASYRNHERSLSVMRRLSATAAGLTRDDGDLISETHPDQEGAGGIYLLRKHFTLKRDVTLHAAGADVALGRGDRLDMGYSCKYTPVGFVGLPERSGGMRVERSFTSDDGRFLVAAARRHRV